VKCDMAGLVPQDKFAHGGQGTVGRMISQQSIISRAHQLGEQQDLQFKSDTEDAPAKAKGRETPVRGDITPIKPPDGATEQSRVLRFLSKPHLNDLAQFLAAIPKSVRVVSDQRGRTTTIAKPKLFDRSEERKENGWLNRHRRSPVGLGAMSAITFKMRDPFGMIHNLLPTITFTLRYKVYDESR
jgi:hypothetical protein